MDKIKLEHESYGMLDIYRATGGSKRLFGSDIKHSNTIRIAINQADVTRSLNREWYHSGDRLIEIELSPVQFAEAITNMNTNGVPCTIRYKGYEAVEDCPDIENKKEVFRNEFNKDMSEITKIIKNLSTEIEDIISQKKTMTKSDKEKIQHGLNRINQQLQSNIPYMVECFDEQINKSIAHSKAEIEAYVQNKINSLGIQALNEKILELE